MEKNKSIEIGSEFWFPSINSKIDTTLNDFLFPSGSVNELVLSGRTAIDIICKDIKFKKRKCKVYIPAYCCESMVFPFISNKFEVDFYDVSLDSEKKFVCNLDLSKDIQILYITNYFGYPNCLDISLVKSLQEQGIIIIYDRTHSLFLKEDPLVNIADYSFASIRKWCGVATGAVVTNHNESFFEHSLKSCPYVDYKFKGMELKELFIYGDKGINKDDFFKLFNAFSNELKVDYSLYSIDEKSFDVINKYDFNSLEEKRNNNATYLYDNLKDTNLSFYFGSPKGFAPLFVPVFFNSKEERNFVRKHLIDNQIYCPVHWPKSDLIPESMETFQIYDREMSLVCDQRYNLTDMKRIVENIKQVI